MKKKTTNLLPFILFFCGMGLFAQTNKSVGIGTTMPNQSAVLHLESNNQGFLMPHLTNTQITAITSPMNGLIVYSTTDSCYWFYKANRWDKICGTQHIIANYISTDTLIANTATIDSLITHYINTNYIHATTIVTDSITAGVGSFDTLLINGQTINNVVTNQIDTTAWLLKGNSGTNPTVNFLGTKDSNDLVLRTNNLERMRVAANGGNVGIGTNTPNQSAILDLESINKGILVPQLTAAQIAAITSPANGLLVYSITDSCFWFYKTFIWQRICGTDHLITSYISTDTLIANTATINTATITSLTTNTFIASTGTVNVLNTDTIHSNYISSNTIVTNTITAGVGSFDTLLINGQTINNVVTNQIDTTAWLLKGNSGTNPTVNFLGTKDTASMVVRTNNLERLRVLGSNGNVGIGTNSPTNNLDINGGLRVRPGAALNYVLLSDANGNGTWQNPLTTILTYTTIGNYAWELLGNSGTNPTINFLGSADTASMVIRTHNIERMRVLGSNGNVGIGTNSPTNNLDINGGLRVRPGAALNYVLLSDANGNGTWQNPLTTILTYTTVGNYAWELLGNTGITAATDFIGTTDTGRVVIRQKNRGRILIENADYTNRFGVPVYSPRVYIGDFTNPYTQTIYSELDVNGQITMRTGASNSYIMQSNANGTGSWIAPTTALNSVAWELSGNSGTNSTINFIGTTDAQNLTVRTNSLSVFTFNTSGQLQAINNGSAVLPVYNFNANVNSGMWYNPTDASINLNTPPSWNPLQGFVSANFGQNINITPSTAFYYGGSASPLNTISANETAECIIGQGNSLTNNGVEAGNMVYGNSNILGTSNLSTIVGTFNNMSTTTLTTLIGEKNTVTTDYYGAVVGAFNTVYAPGGGFSSVFGDYWNITHSNAFAIGYGFTLNSFATSGLQLMGVGGTRVYSNTSGTTGVSLASGGGSWTTVSDRRLKENITEIKTEDVLNKVLSVPVTEWNYITQKVDTMNKYAPAGIHYDKAPVHIGPMAQDFWAAFGYGEFTDKITSSDIDGVMFSAIQALAAKQKDVETLTVLVSDFKKQIIEMKSAIEELKRK
ncbi:MAG: tail fiber domain-containing protein [Bacteroidia bacterium]